MRRQGGGIGGRCRLPLPVLEHAQAALPSPSQARGRTIYCRWSQRGVTVFGSRFQQYHHGSGIPLKVAEGSALGSAPKHRITSEISAAFDLAPRNLLRRAQRL